MNNTQFIKIIRTFSADEIKKFRKFLLSPYFNTNKTLVKLLDHLTYKYNGYTNINEIKVFQFLYPGKQYNKKRIRDLSSEILGLCERFLAEIQFGADNYLLNLNYLKSINSRNIRQNFLNKYRQIEEKLLKKNLDYEYFNNLQFIYKEYLKFCNSYEISSVFDSVSKIRENTLNSALLEILRFNLGVSFMKYEFNRKIEIIQVEDILRISERGKINLHPILKIYYELYRANLKFDIKSYYNIKKDFFRNQEFMDTTVVKEIMINTLNILIENINLIPESIYSKEIIELLTIMHEEGLFYDNNGYMIFGYFFSYADMLINNSEFEKANKFITENQSKIVQDRLNIDMVNTMYGKMYFKMEKYTVAIERLEKVTNSDVILYLQKKRYLLMSNFELGNYIICEQMVSSINKLYTRSKRYTNDPTRFVIFVKYLNKLLLSLYEKDSLKKLLFTLQNETKFSGQKWLIAKINEFIKAKKY